MTPNSPLLCGGCAARSIARSYRPVMPKRAWRDGCAHSTGGAGLAPCPVVSLICAFGWLAVRWSPWNVQITAPMTATAPMITAIVFRKSRVVRQNHLRLVAAFLTAADRAQVHGDRSGRGRSWLASLLTTLERAASGQRSCRCRGLSAHPDEAFGPRIEFSQAPRGTWT
jgi:hypothetical protein